MKKILSFAMAFLMVLSFASCMTEEPVAEEKPDAQEFPETSESQETVDSEIIPESEERREVSAENFKDAVKIVLSEEITVDGKIAEESGCVTVGGEIIYYRNTEKYESGNKYGEGAEDEMHTEEEAAEHTLVTITKPGEYFVTGELKGQLAVDLGKDAKNDPDAKVTLIFGGADITCEIAPAVIFYNVYECGSSEKAEENVDTSKAGAKVIIADGSRSNIKGANVAKIFMDDKEEKELHKYDSAFYSKMTMNIDGGEKNSGILSITGENEGLGTEMHLTLNGGRIIIRAEDDGINTNEDGISVTAVNGGKLVVNGGLGYEGDGIDSNGWIVINGGEVYAYGNGRSSDGGIDADNDIIINGGKVVAFGSRNDNISAKSKQLFVKLDFYEDIAAGSKIEFFDENGKGVSEVCEREFSNVVFSEKDFVENGKYSLSVDGVLQEYSLNNPKIEDYIEYGLVTDMLPQKPEGYQVPEDPINNPYKVPENLEQWLKKENDIPEEIREWIENMAKASENIDYENFGGSFRPNASGRIEDSVAGGEDILNPKTEENKTVFILEKGKLSFSGIVDSLQAMGKQRVYFTINDESWFEDLFCGDLPEITEIGCSKKVPPEDIIIKLVYRGREKTIDVSRSCVLSDGIEEVIGLFEGLLPGNYCLSVSVADENESFGGSTIFNFKVLD